MDMLFGRMMIGMRMTIKMKSGAKKKSQLSLLRVVMDYLTMSQPLGRRHNER